MVSANFYLTDAEDRYIWIKADSQLVALGYRASEMLGKAVWDCFPPEWVHRYRSLHERTKLDGRARTFFTPHVVDSDRFCMITIIRSGSGILCVSTEVGKPTLAEVRDALRLQADTPGDPLRDFFERHA
jgi:hypothetical protein